MRIFGLSALIALALPLASRIVSVLFGLRQIRRGLLLQNINAFALTFELFGL